MKDNKVDSQYIDYLKKRNKERKKENRTVSKEYFKTKILILWGRNEINVNQNKKPETKK